MTKMDLATKLALRFVLALYIVPVVYVIRMELHMPTIKYIKAKDTYVRSIKGDPIFTHEVEKFLNHFNSKVSTNIVPKKGTRPIDIELIDDYVWNGFGPYVTLGQALPLWNSCKITIAIKRHFDTETFKNTTIHEYLHCFGYEHVDKQHDLMYKYNDDISSDSVDSYAKDLEETLK